jgi:hypothetical protein
MSTMIEKNNLVLWEGVRRFATLPDWLDAATQPERLVESLVRVVPEFASGAQTILECDIGHVRFKRDVWTGVYELTIAGADGAEPRVVALRGTILSPERVEAHDPQPSRPFGSDGWQAYLPDLNLKLEMRPPDAALPALPILTDSEQARELLERSIRLAAPRYQDLQIAASAPKIMRYSPGSRCTILYRLEYPAEFADRDWPAIVVAKTYKGGKGKHAYAGMRALWESEFAHGGVTLAEPLAFLPDLNVLVQGPILEDQTLQELITAALRAGTAEALEQLYATLRQTAEGLAGLHCSEVRFGAVRTWEDELAEVRSVVDNLTSAIPWIAAAAAPLLERLEALAALQTADPIMTVHGTFRPGQVLLHNGDIGFIDFESFCQAEPALDLSLFLRRTKDIALSVLNDDAGTNQAGRAALLAQAEAICEVFLSAYEARVPVSRQRVALWEALDLFTLVLHCWTKVKPERLNNSMFALEHHLRGMEI